MRTTRFSFALTILTMTAVSIAMRAEAAPTEITQCTTITESGSYIVVNNLNLPLTTTECLLIAADFVTVDLSGFVIRGHDPISPPFKTGIRSDGHRRAITVRDGTITGFTDGIHIDGDNVHVERIQVILNGTGISLSSTGVRSPTNFIVKDCVASDSILGNGITVNGAGVISGNVASRNASFGIKATGDAATVVGNVARSNGNVGIAAGGTIVNNTASGNAGTGIAVSCPSALVGNTSIANANSYELFGTGCNTAHNAPLVP
jgi:hypothetical protein